MTTHVIAIDTNGTIRFVHDDALAPAPGEGLLALGEWRVRRASHIEPDPKRRGWIADLSPMEGPMLGPFPTREEALREERRWIETEIVSR